MHEQDIRWKQRFENYARAVALVEEALANGSAALSKLEREGLMQRFEYTVELGWKTMKDYMDHAGLRLETLTPKAVVAAAWQARIIPDGQIWVDMLVHRNMLSHRYDEEAVNEVVKALEGRYLTELKALRQWLADREGE
jgi:nucleotidyltransferase substrate binding protein (TIGR01987 family)